jgi:hypothetical protein
MTLINYYIRKLAILIFFCLLLTKYTAAQKKANEFRRLLTLSQIGVLEHMLLLHKHTTKIPC